MRKPSPRAVLKNLPQEQQEALAAFLSESVIEKDDKGKQRVRGRTLAEGVAYAADVLKVKTNDSSLSDWFPWFKLTQRLNSLADTADTLKAEMANTDLDADLVPKLAQQFFLSQAAENADAKTFAHMASVIQRHYELKAQEAAHADKMTLGQSKIATQRQSIRIAERRAEAAERRVAALEEKNRLLTEAANKAKSALKGGSMSDEDRAALIATMDELLLGKAAKKKEAAK